MTDDRIILQSAQAYWKAQGWYHGAIDGLWGPMSAVARAQAAKASDGIQATSEHPVLASSFADPVDVAAFRKCKAKGGTDQECFKVGDNGIGCWGDDTTAPRPMCALPPEDWRPLGSKARGAIVSVKANNREILCELRDTMPAKANIKNGAGIDLNPAAVAALGLKPPILTPATWRFLT